MKFLLNLNNHDSKGEIPGLAPAVVELNDLIDTSGILEPLPLVLSHLLRVASLTITTIICICEFWSNASSMSLSFASTGLDIFTPAGFHIHPYRISFSPLQGLIFPPTESHIHPCRGSYSPLQGLLFTPESRLYLLRPQLVNVKNHDDNGTSNSEKDYNHSLLIKNTMIAHMIDKQGREDISKL